MQEKTIITEACAQWPDSVTSAAAPANLLCKPSTLVELCDWLANRQGYHFAGLTVEENDAWKLHYLFVGPPPQGRIVVACRLPQETQSVPSISGKVHAADWHEREAEDLFGLVFAGHPRLGDFILHDDAWQEGIEPMRPAFDADAALAARKPQQQWRPRRIVQAPGAFIMPIGPVFSGEAEAVHFQLETIGEDILRAYARLFFKYRGVEKRAEGRSVDEGLLLAERFAGTAAFAHALAFCQALEQLGDTAVPQRARVLRVFVAELERLRSHVQTIEGICNSTGLVVAAAQAGILEEELLRLAGALTGHRYFFGLTVPGGLSRDLSDGACHEVLMKARDIVHRLAGLEKLLVETSSFLDRIEEVGSISTAQARGYGLVGPVARGSGYAIDLRQWQPYCGYDDLSFEIPSEEEGDGYARLRVLVAEVRQSLRLMEQATAALPPGPVLTPSSVTPGTAAAGVEAPRGAAWHWVNVDREGNLVRYHILSPSFANWHGFHLAVEGFAFQDFPIILATFGLSVAESDR